jgi:hypothetical protein
VPQRHSRRRRDHRYARCVTRRVNLRAIPLNTRRVSRRSGRWAVRPVRRPRR